ncbi:MAG: GNAT family N-acetyltransferase [Bacteriovoracaceae bacterium]|nr:GNAT family N-acetyltransferase [Bacteriovoracaceae bacterium]
MMSITALYTSSLFAFERFPLYLELKKLEGSLIRPHVSIKIDGPNYEIKTLDCPHELMQVLRLRFDVFFKEPAAGKTYSFFPYDIDMHDFNCDHLIVKDKATDSVVACYRMQAFTNERKVQHFYSEGEFNLDQFIKLPGNKLELGRACVHKDFRNGTVISLLWKGLLEYARRVDARYMFGCSSVARKDFANYPSILSHLHKINGFIKDYSVLATKDYSLDRYPQLKTSLCAMGPTDGKGVNSLMHMYLLAGAKMSETPAYDAEMDCLDFFTVMDMQEIPASFVRRFQ